MNTSIWQQVHMPRFPKLKGTGHYDVVIVGGGTTGLVSAFLLNQAGKRVCLLERDRLASGDTGHTTAHLTEVTDMRLAGLVNRYGQQQAALAWQGGVAAINMIADIVETQQIDCQFHRVPGFLHAPLAGRKDNVQELRDEADCALELGFDARFLSAVPFVGKPGVRYSNQAKFHPLQFLRGVAERVSAAGCDIFEHSECTAVESNPLAVVVGGARLTADYVIIATHVPLMGKTGLIAAAALQTKLAAYSSYVVGAKVPRGIVPDASFWDTSESYFYLRCDAGGRSDYVILGGADHKTGQNKETSTAYETVEKMLAKIVPRAKIAHRWSGQVIETSDGLPLIGETADRQFVATGFAGNGMTYGVLAGMMATDRVMQRENPWQDLFDPSRKKIRGAAMRYLKENADFPYYLVHDRLSLPDEAPSTRAVHRGEGRIVKSGGTRVACYRDEQGELTTVSAVCTHMGCLVHWNGAEKTWDCPCHGSRFQPDGSVIAGPAETPLEPVSVAKSAAKAESNGHHQRAKKRKPKAHAVRSKATSRIR